MTQHVSKSCRGSSRYYKKKAHELDDVSIISKLCTHFYETNWIALIAWTQCCDYGATSTNVPCFFCARCHEPASDRRGYHHRVGHQVCSPRIFQRAGHGYDSREAEKSVLAVSFSFRRDKRPSANDDGARPAITWQSKDIAGPDSLCRTSFIGKVRSVG